MGNSTSTSSSSTATLNNNNSNTTQRRPPRPDTAIARLAANAGIQLNDNDLTNNNNRLNTSNNNSNNTTPEQHNDNDNNNNNNDRRTSRIRSSSTNTVNDNNTNNSTSSARDALVSSRTARNNRSINRYNNILQQPIHFAVACDMCGRTPIIGARYHCTECSDYDLCSRCFRTFNIDYNDHRSTHAMECIERPPNNANNQFGSAEQFIRNLLQRGARNIRLVDVEHDPEFAERYRAFMEEAFYNGPKGYPPASQRLIDSLTTDIITPQHTAYNKECLICLETFEDNQSVKQMQCSLKHWFHSDCLVQWLKEHGSCPIDRETVETEDEAQQAIKNSQTV